MCTLPDDSDDESAVVRKERRKEKGKAGEKGKWGREDD